MRRLTLLITAALLMALTLFAGDPTGTWTGSMPTSQGDTRDVTFKLKAEGGALTGTMAVMDNDVPISDGKISGDNLSFTVSLDFGGNSFKLNFTGVQKGDELQMTREREGGGTKQNFTVKRKS